MSQFIAIPVGQGDAFYLKLPDTSLLVDGGRARRSFSNLFQKYTSTDYVHVAVCTHNDADHANGLIGFLEDGLKCDEIWLPGCWLSVLPDILKPFVEIVDTLVGNIFRNNISFSDDERRPRSSPLEMYGERLQDNPSPKEQGESGIPIDQDGWSESLISALEQAESWETVSWCHQIYFGVLHLTYIEQGLRDPMNVQLLWSALDAASRVRDIAIIAFNRGIPVRWFQYELKNPSGGETWLRPLNAREIIKVNPPTRTLLDRLALTVSNKESLVFWSPPTDLHPGVLFTADSDLAGIKLPSTELCGAISTAPHHGSETNSKAYGKVAQAVHGASPTVTWVRSDGNYRSRPGKTYRALHINQRLCTRCKPTTGTTFKEQEVRLVSQNGTWAKHPQTNSCSCP